MNKKKIKKNTNMNKKKIKKQQRETGDAAAEV